MRNTSNDFVHFQLLPTGTKLETHRQSFSELLTQGIKRVNSASNLAIPGISSLNQGSRSLPPTPQHSPRYEFAFTSLHAK